MASGSTAAPSLFLQERHGPGQGLVRVRRVHLLVHVGEPRHARACSTASRSSPTCPERTRSSSIVLAAIAVTFLAVAYAGPDRRDAARRRRLRLAEPRPRRHPGHRRRRASSAPSPCTWSRRRSASADALPYVAGVLGVLVGGPSAAEGRHRLRPRRRPAGGSSSRCGRRSTARSSRSSSSSRSPRSFGLEGRRDVLRHRRRDVRRLDHHDRR